MFYDGSVHKLQVNMVNELGDTALHMASKWGYGECEQQREKGAAGADSPPLVRVRTVFEGP